MKRSAKEFLEQKLKKLKESAAAPVHEFGSAQDVPAPAKATHDETPILPVVLTGGGPDPQVLPTQQVYAQNTGILPVIDPVDVLVGSQQPGVAVPTPFEGGNVVKPTTKDYEDPNNPRGTPGQGTDTSGPGGTPSTDWIKQNLDPRTLPNFNAQFYAALTSGKANLVNPQLADDYLRYLFQQSKLPSNQRDNLLTMDLEGFDASQTNDPQYIAKMASYSLNPKKTVIDEQAKKDFDPTKDPSKWDEDTKRRWEEHVADVKLNPWNSGSFRDPFDAAADRSNMGLVGNSAAINARLDQGNAPLDPIKNNANSTLRNHFVEAGAQDVIPSRERQLQSNVLFDSFNTVPPGFGLGQRNKLFVENEQRDAFLRYQNNYWPRADNGAFTGVTPAPWQLQEVQTKEQVASWMRSVDEKLAAVKALVTQSVASGKSVGTLPDDVVTLPSTKGLPRPLSMFMPVNHNYDSFVPVLDPAGMFLNRRARRHLHSSWRNPLVDETDVLNSGSTFRRRRQLAFNLP